MSDSTEAARWRLMAWRVRPGDVVTVADKVRLWAYLDTRGRLKVQISGDQDYGTHVVKGGGDAVE